MFHRPLKDGACDVCGGVLTRRVDDNEQAVRARLEDYHQKTQPILDLFRQKELVVVADGTKAPDAVQADIRRQLKLQP
jgi:adenylate kinase